ncbi:MAG TPA: DNA polymerase III subunit chi [Burkholderiaceae bacterium]|nr:DNA polymerase III subunit chi [Burkholderiaceae bacterium]
MKLEFHTGLPDKPAFACRLLRKAFAADARVAVCGDPPALDHLDTLLWTFEVGSFVPHVRCQRGAAPKPGWARTPIWLVDDAAAAPDCATLVNLGPAMAAGWEGFARVIELVGDDADDVRAGRQRWRVYEQAGHPPVHHRRDKAQA